MWAELADDGKSFVLNGTKLYVTNGGWADVFIIFAKVDGNVKFQKGLKGRTFVSVVPAAEAAE